MDFIGLAKEYGLVVAIAVILHIPPYTYILRNMKSIGKISDIEKKIDNVHDGCHIPVEAMNKLQGEVSELKRQDTKLEERFTEKFEGLEKALNGVSERLEKGQTATNTRLDAIYQVMLELKK